MRLPLKIKIILLLFIFICSFLYAEEKKFIVVAQDGTGDFKNITDAINSLPMFNYQRTTIYVKNGIYIEKIRISQDFITIEGESREKTIIKFSQLRSDWQANKDTIGPAVINIYGDDFILKNITVENTQPEIGPHAFAIYGTATRTIILNSTIKSKGADTVSLWNYKNGMYYHSNCYFEGAVDFVCPRGWCFIRDSQFYELKQTASVWHAGGEDENQKFVIKNSSFDGVEGFELGRHHYDAQFYFINCSFSNKMSTKEIYRVTYPNEPERDRPFNWGKRVYFYNSKADTQKYYWLKNNLPNNISNIETINPAWTFDNKWNPEKTIGPTIIDYKIIGRTLLLHFDDKITVYGKPILKSSSGKLFVYKSGAGSDTINFECDSNFRADEMTDLTLINDAKITGTTASVQTLNADLIFKTLE